MVLAGTASAGEIIGGYSAQEGGGAGKNYNANDKNSITDFTARSGL